jgi:hypothetical protein
MGLAETPGCATLLPASLFISSQPGTGSFLFEGSFEGISAVLPSCGRKEGFERRAG